MAAERRVRPRRLRWSGNFARWATYPFFTIFLLSCWRYLANGPDIDPGADPWSPTSVTIATGFAVVSLAAIVRGAMLGIWVSPDELIVRSWFATWRIDRSAIGGFISSGYWGMFVTGESSWVTMITVDRRGGRAVTARGSLAFRRTTRRQVAALREWRRSGQLVDPRETPLTIRQPQHEAALPASDGAEPPLA